MSFSFFDLFNSFLVLSGCIWHSRVRQKTLLSCFGKKFAVIIPTGYYFDLLDKLGKNNQVIMQ